MAGRETERGARGSMLLLYASVALSSTAAVSASSAGTFALSHTLGDHAVLQNPAVLHGTGSAGATVTTTASVDGTLLLTQLTTTVGADGIWRQPLPTMPEGFTPHSFNIKSGDTELTLVDILFGKTLLCSGQVWQLTRLHHTTSTCR